jgi:hypothetical protein
MIGSTDEGSEQAGAGTGGESPAARTVLDVVVGRGSDCSALDDVVLAIRRV